MIDLSARVLGAVFLKLKQRPFLIGNTLLFRVADEDSRIAVGLVGSEAEFEGEIITSSLILRPEKVYEFYEKIQSISRSAVLEITSFTSQALQVTPKLSFSLSIFDTDIDPAKIAKEMAKRDGLSQMQAATMWYYDIGHEEIDKFADIICEEVAQAISDLNEIKKSTDKFRIYDVRAKSVNELWRKSELETNAQKRGQLLENLVTEWIKSDDNFGIKSVNCKTESEEIDIVIENRAKTDFLKQLQSPLILVECKNWSNKVGAKEIRDFAQKIQNRPRFLCKVGLMITTSNFTEDSERELLGYRGKDFLVATADRLRLQEAITKGVPFSDLCREQIYAAGLK